MVAGLEPKHVLVLDDDPTCRDVVEFALANAGLDVTVAARAVDALVLASRRHFDLVVADYFLPDYPGTDFVRLLRARHDYKDVPVILLTSRACELDRRRLSHDLCLLVLSKGCSTECLLTVVFKCLAVLRDTAVEIRC